MIIDEPLLLLTQQPNITKNIHTNQKDMILSMTKKTLRLPKLQQRILDLEIVIEITKIILQDTIRNLTKKKSNMVQRLLQGLQNMNGDKSKEIIN